MNSYLTPKILALTHIKKKCVVRLGEVTATFRASNRGTWCSIGGYLLGEDNARPCARHAGAEVALSVGDAEAATL